MGVKNKFKDCLGRLEYSGKFVSEDEKLNLNHLTSGFYLLQVQSEGGMQVKRFEIRK